MIEQPKSSLQPITELQKEAGEFQYGRDRGAFVDGSEYKNTRQMHRKVMDIVQTLQLPFTLSDAMPMIRHKNGPAFVKVTSNDYDFYLHARSIINDKKTLAGCVDGKPVVIHAVSGPCLFSAHSVFAVTEDGEKFSLTTPGAEIPTKVQDIEIDPQLSLYEIEASVRLSLFISELAKGSSSVESVRLNLPRVEYYNYALSALENGYLSPQQMLEWFHAVDSRFNRLQQIMKRRIRKPLPKDKQPLFISTQPLGILEDYIKESVLEADIPELNKAKRILALSSPLWETVLALQNPQTWIDLNNASYIVAELQAGRIPKHDDSSAHMAVVVENYTENKIFASAKKVYDALPDKTEDYNLIGLYPHEHVVPASEHETKTMYHIGKPEEMGTHNARTIFRAYQARKQI